MLGSAVFRQLPPDLKDRQREWPSVLVGAHLPDIPSTASTCRLDSEAVELTTVQPLHPAAATLPDRQVVTRRNVQSHEHIATLSIADPLVTALMSVPVNPVGPPNISTEWCNCRDGLPHVLIKAIAPLATGEHLRPPCPMNPTRPPDHRPGLLLQFDGSAHADSRVGGAGSAIFAIWPDKLELLHYQATALQSCADNIVAESLALEQGVVDLVDIIDGTDEYDPGRCIIQGDILPLLRHIAGHGRFRRAELVQTIEHIQELRARHFPKAHLTYLPREANKVADFLAGEASAFARTNPDSVYHDGRLDISDQIRSGMLERALFFGFTVGVPPTRLVRPVLLLREHSDWKLNCAELVAWMQQNPTKANVCSQYLIALRAAHNGLTVPYTARVVDDRGRLYAHGHSAQSLPREFRLLLFGHSHVEIDLIGAFYELTRRLAQSKLGIGGSFPPVVDLRSMLRRRFSALGCPQSSLETVVKKWPLVALNGSTEQLIAWSRHHVTLDLPFDFLALAQQLHAAGKRIALEFGPRIRQLDEACHLSAFRTLEQFEVSIMTRLLEGLQQGSRISSCIWLHDGLWISPAPDIVLLKAIEQRIFQSWDLPLESHALSFVSLTQKRQQVASLLSLPPGPMVAGARTASDPRPLWPLVEWHRVEIQRTLLDAADDTLLQYLRKLDD